MTYPFPKFEILQDQIVEFVDVVAGIGFRVITVDKGQLVPQHHHDDYEHAAFVGAGSARLWINGVWTADLFKGRAIAVKKGDEHLWQALEDGTLLACITDSKSAEQMMREKF